MTIGSFGREVVKWLEKKAAPAEWNLLQIPDYLVPSYWEVAKYEQDDYGAEGDFNLRTMKHKLLPGKVLLKTDASDTEVILVSADLEIQDNPYSVDENFNNFMGLFNGPDYFLPQPEPEPEPEPDTFYVDFGSW